MTSEGRAARPGFIGHVIGWILLETTLGLTAYFLFAHPEGEGPQVRDAVLGHTTATACRSCLGLRLSDPSGVTLRQPRILQRAREPLPRRAAA